jgi:hypothetical protein
VCEASAGGAAQGDLRVGQKSLGRDRGQAYTFFDRPETDGKHAKSASEKVATTMKSDFSVGGALAHVSPRLPARLRRETAPVKTRGSSSRAGLVLLIVAAGGAVVGCSGGSHAPHRSRR